MFFYNNMVVFIYLCRVYHNHFNKGRGVNDNICNITFNDLTLYISLFNVFCVFFISIIPIIFTVQNNTWN